MPVGLYQITHESVRPGADVLLRMPLKQVIAVAGDHVEFSAAGFRVNGQMIPNSAPEPGYEHWWYGRSIVPVGMVLCLANHPDSWDGRYVGYVPLSLVYSTAKPVWTEPNGYEPRH